MIVDNWMINSQGIPIIPRLTDYVYFRHMIHISQSWDIIGDGAQKRDSGDIWFESGNKVFKAYQND